jgi:serine/threonine-protein kinase
MELVEGPTLADRIAQGPIPVDEALLIAKQISEALEAAHEQGIIHRDLKPANIKLRPDGTVKVLDFGLAKALDPASGAIATSHSPTITSPAMMTGVGVLLGTAAYMSPEQARGKAVDKRSDIWAFGCVLYEMLTGRRAFEDEDVSMTLSKVLQREPDFEAFPADVPARVRQTVRLCLRKPVKERVPDIGAVRLALEGAFETTATQTAVATVAHPPERWRRHLAPALASLVTAVVAALAAWNLWPSTELPLRSLVRFEVNTPPDGPLTMTATMRDVAISPDGTRIVYQSSVANTASGRRLYVRQADRVDATMVRGTSVHRARSSLLTVSGWGLSTPSRVA